MSLITNLVSGNWFNMPASFDKGGSTEVALSQQRMYHKHKETFRFRLYLRILFC